MYKRNICENVNLLNFYLFKVLISINLNKKSNVFFILQINIFNIFSPSISLNFVWKFHFYIQITKLCFYKFTNKKTLKYILVKFFIIPFPCSNFRLHLDFFINFIICYIKFKKLALEDRLNYIYLLKI